ncbi:helix-turn-helix domain-containing protein [Azonexus sp. R2A61]|uniref:helix-turn-helix domain-containing protein n=1 Tax=Azonexus sp. R2A61 TaxID=2744443 RepID=UPI001F3BEFAD|nr:helix-turn-helix domain-containing protein [Azonexus sp. R2A61]
MHHEKIKAEMRIAGKTPAALARELKVSRACVSGVMRGDTRSKRVASAIAKVVGKPIDLLWPGKYPSASSI